MQELLEQLKGRDVRFILTKSDLVSQSQSIMLVGQLLWALSPIMPSDTPPQVYALTSQYYLLVSDDMMMTMICLLLISNVMTASPTDVYNPFLDLQEQEWLKDLSNLISGVSRVESRVAAVRRHAVRVRNHAKVVDCYLAVLNKNRGFFSFGSPSKKQAMEITENPHQHNIFAGSLAGVSKNVSRYDLPDSAVYREFFRINPLVEFKPLTAHCSFFRGCPLDKLDIAISYKLPDLVAKFKKLSKPSKPSK